MIYMSLTSFAITLGAAFILGVIVAVRMRKR